MFVDIFNTDKKYRVIYADPPWQFGSKELYGDKNKEGKRENRFRTLDRIYKTMSIKEIKKLPIKEITEKDAICFMWVTDSHLKEGIELLEAWGFKYKTIGFNWIKYSNKGNLYFNVAPWTLKSWEVCLIGTKGSMSKYKKTNNIKGLLQEERTKHSKKPIETANRINELFGDESKIELFARDTKEGWDYWGNEVK